jgi:hypothetical protein
MVRTGPDAVRPKEGRTNMQIIEWATSLSGIEWALALLCVVFAIVFLICTPRAIKVALYLLKGEPSSTRGLDHLEFRIWSIGALGALALSIGAGYLVYASAF